MAISPNHVLYFVLWAIASILRRTHPSAVDAGSPLTSHDCHEANERSIRLEVKDEADRMSFWDSLKALFGFGPRPGATGAAAGASGAGRRIPRQPR